MVRVALVGCGTMGRVHTNGYKNIDNAKLVAVCDINREKAQLLSDINGSKVYTSFDEMLKNEEFDILDVCLPTYMHKEFSLKGMDCGKHIFCEKPIALSVEDANIMIDTAKEKGLKFSVGHVLRFFPAYKSAIKTVESGKTGPIKLIRTTRNQGFPQWSWENWYNDYEKSGGPIVDLIIHDFDWIAQSFGDVDRVYAKSFNGKVENKEHCMATLRLKNGAIAHVEGSWGFPNGYPFRTTFELVGTQGQIEYDNIKNAGVEKMTCDEVYKAQYISPNLPTTEPYTAELRQFIDCVENNTPVIVTGEQAVKALKIALAAVESSQTGMPVQL